MMGELTEKFATTNTTHSEATAHIHRLLQEIKGRERGVFKFPPVLKVSSYRNESILEQICVPGGWVFCSRRISAVHGVEDEE